MTADYLTAKQRAFVEEYQIDLNATQAAIRAGYSKDTAYSIGWENLKKPEIQSAIAQAMKMRSERAEVTADRVVEIISDTIEKCRQDNKFQAANVLKGCELLGKHIGMFTDKQDIKLSGEVGGQWKVNVVKPQQSK